MSHRACCLLISGFIPLLLLASEVDEQFLDAVRKSDVATVKGLLAKGVSVNTKFRYDRMALSFACDRGNIEVVKALLDAGADVNARDSFYQADAMAWAVMKGHLDIIVMLLQKGARNDEGVLMAGVTRNSPALVKASLDRGGLPPESLTVALARASRENFTGIVDLLKAANAAPPVSVETATLEKYSGTYRDQNGQELVIDQKDGVLRGRLYGEDPLPLVALAKDRFRPEAIAGVVVTFLSEGDRVTSVTLHQGDNETQYAKAEAKP
jgi:ankyrin repeat protein